MDEYLIVGIPGPWKDRSALMRALVEGHNGRYLFAGMILLDVQEDEPVEMEIYDPDPNLARAFEIAGQGKLSADTLRKIQTHRQTVYLKFRIPDPTLRAKLLKFTRIFQQIGGYAVKVETSGVAHEFSRWLSWLESPELFDFYCALLTLAAGDDLYYSCGMHQFQLPDCCISNREDVQHAARTMNIFNMYQLAESPQLESGHTFSISEDAPSYRLMLRKEFLFSDDDLFFNQYGRWVLERV